MKKLFYTTWLSLLIVISGYSKEFSGYQLYITISTTSDWCRLTLLGETPLAILDYEVLLDESPNEVIGMLAINQPGNTYLVKVKYAAFLLDERLNEDFKFESTKGDWGDVKIKIEGYKNESLTTVKQFNNLGYIIGDPTNRMEFTVPLADIMSLDIKHFSVSEQKIPHTVFAFYYPWYGSPDGPNGDWFHWDPNNHYASTHEPLLGYYDSGSSAVQQQHLSWAWDCGVDVFICSWWGINSYEDKRFPELLNQAQNYPLKLSLYFETNWEINRADENNRPLIIKKHLRYILSNYTNHPSFFRFKGKPVLFLYGLPLSKISAEKWAQVVADLRNEGYDFFISVDSFGLEFIKIFDGVHTYNPLYHTPEQLRGIFKQNLLTSYYHDKVYAATILPGYDDTIIREPGIKVTRENGAFYECQWQILSEAQPAWVLITSWNEWHEGSEIEPSVEYGKQYLELTKEGRVMWDAKDVRIERVKKKLPIDFHLEAAYPNPFNAQVRFRFHIPRPDRVQLNVFNTLGRHIITLLNDKQTTGEHDVLWNGKNNNGQAIPGGLYIIRLKSSLGVVCTKVICLR